MTEWARAFSRPVLDAAPDAAVLDTIASAFGRAVVQNLLDTQTPAVQARSRGLVEALTHVCDADLRFPTVWDIAFGRARLLNQPGTVDPVDVAARLGLRLADRGTTQTWVAAIDPTSMTLGRFYLDDVVAVAVAVGAAGGDEVTLTRASGLDVTFTRVDARHPWSTVGACGVIERIEARTPIHLIARPMLPPDRGSREVFGECVPVASVEPWMAATFQAGYDLLADVAPSYLRWIEPVLHGVVVCTAQAPFHLTSGSWEEIPGYAHISCPHAAVDIADILVHESSHQYFYLLEKVGPLVGAEETALYYSPATRTQRPLSRILMAFHAFVNVLDVYAGVRAKGGEDLSYVVANEPTLRADIATLDEPLRASVHLTALGRSVYEPLVERLAVLSG